MQNVKSQFYKEEYVGNENTLNLNKFLSVFFFSFCIHPEGGDIQGL